MAQTGFTPLLIYSSSTATNAPTAGNLLNNATGSELAINIADGKLFYKDSANAVQVIAWKTTPTTAGGTGLTSWTAGQIPYYASGTALSQLSIGTNGYFLTSSGTAPQWTDPTTIAVTSISFGTTGLTPSTATKGAVTVAGTLSVTNGGTGLTTLAVNYIPYGNGASAFSSSSSLQFNGTALSVGLAASAWSGFSAIQIGNGSSLWSSSSAGAQAAYYSNNLYYNGSNRIYIATGAATEYVQSSGIHYWYTAGSGSAGGTVSLTERMRIHGSGGVSIGNTTDSGAGSLNLSGTLQMPANVAINFAGASQFYYNSSTLGIQYTGNSGANTLFIANNGIVTMNAYGAGAATFSASGVISSVSDETWKTKDGVPTNPDEMLQKLEPGYWFYNEEKAPIFGKDRQLGFYAQNVNAAIGSEAAPAPEKGKPWGYYDRSVLAVTVMSLKNALKAIQELKAEFDAYKASHP